MPSSTPSVRSLFVYALCLPLAAFIGYYLAQPLTYSSLALIGIVPFCLMIPLFLKWHHPWLLASWNMSAVVFFLPGRPPLWMAMTAISLLVIVLQYTLDREKKILSVPGVTLSLVFLALVVVMTAKLTGGMGLRSFGSEVEGGKRYFMILGAVLGYFAISSRRIAPERATLYVTLFFLGGVTMAIGLFFGYISPVFNFLFLVFPIEYVGGVDLGGWSTAIVRTWALPNMALAVFCAMMARYGVRGVLDLTRPWRLGILLFFTLLGMLGGFRSMVVILVATFAILFLVEGLMHTKMLPALALVTILGGALLAAFATHLPPSIQRSLAILPIRVDPMVRADAETSNEWRIQMWRDLLPQIPQHLLLGRGYSFSGEQMDIIQQDARSMPGTAGSEMSTDYHNGPLSVILPLGLPGTFAFLWFLYMGFRVTYRNYKYGAPELAHLNRFMFAYFLARTVFFFTVFGSLYSDMVMFAGLVGLSVSLNGGVATPAPVPQPEFRPERLRPSPVFRRPVNV